mmetsp:Transcript_10072/g.15923  ORF Transcript_10072/g.15923 Transcript_10072/m.15923 type:complete len:431 (+) Transcript_10072:537-1829(+)
MENELASAQKEQNNLQKKVEIAHMEKEEQQIHLQQLRERAAAQKQDSTKQESWSVVSVLSETIWGPPKCDFITDISLYEIHGKLGRNRKTSRVRKATKDKKTVALKLFVYDTETIFPASYINTAKKYWMRTEDRTKFEQDEKINRNNEITRVFREPMILYNMKCCRYINSLQQIVKPRQRGEFYVELEYMDKDLEKIVEEEGEGELLSEKYGPDYIRLLLFNILTAVDFVHSSEVVHRNLCPQAILLQRDTPKLGSFSQAISVRTITEETNLPDYLPSDKRFLAPELWTLPHDSIPSFQWKSIDMWAVGCLMAYAIRGSSIFDLRPGTTQNEWLAQVFSITECRPSDGSVSQEISHSPLSEFVSFSCDEEKNLLSSLLCFESSRRLTARQALNHSYFDPIRGNSGSFLPLAGNICEDAMIFPFFSSLTNL